MKNSATKQTEAVLVKLIKKFLERRRKKGQIEAGSGGDVNSFLESWGATGWPSVE